jgi:hypothetical protein
MHSSTDSSPVNPLTVEEWLARRHAHTTSSLSWWERDNEFLEHALATWPFDMAKVSRGGYPSQTARTYLRLRHEGYAGRRKEENDAT